MCGIFAIFGQSKNLDKYIIEKNISKSFLNFSFRGPDNSNIINFSDNELHFTIGHHRLKILDLSNNSNQPITDKELTMIFNGEIFNFKELNAQYFPNSIYKSDTLLIFNLIKKIGFEKTVNEIKGQYAIISFDKKYKKIDCASDFFNQKPIYYFQNNEILILSSNLNSIIEILKFNKISTKSIHYYSYLNYIPYEMTPYENIFKFKRNQYLQFIFKDNQIKKCTKIIQKKKSIIIDKYDDIEVIEEKLTEIVKKHLNSDVKIAALLSGGIDSSLICMLISKITKDIETYSINFENENFSELEQIKSFSNQIGLKNTAIIPSDNEFNEFFKNSALIFEEPFADSSAINSYIISKKISINFKTCITGDGGDELFYGYSRHQFDYFMRRYPSLFKILRHNKTIIKKFIGNNLHVNKIMNLLKYDQVNNYFISLSPEIDKILSSNLILEDKDFSTNDTFRNQDINFYLPYDINVKNDRTSMFNSLEMRSPFLYEDTFAIAENYNEKDHINIFSKKRLLKKILDKNNIKYENKKRGFSFDLVKYLKIFSKDYIKHKYDIINDTKLLDYQKIPYEITPENVEKIWNRLILSNWIEKNY